MLDRTKIKKHYVWDGNERPENPEERYLLWVNTDGSCYVVSDDCEKRFMDDERFKTSIYANYGEEVTQPKKRFMTDDEMLKFCIVNINKIIISYGRNPFQPVGWYLLTDTPSKYKFMYVDQLDKPKNKREVHLFEVPE